MPERERRHVEQQEVVGRGADLAGENLRLHGGAQRDHFVGIEFGVEFLAAGVEVEEFGDERAHGGNARRAADHDDFVDLLRGETVILQRLANRSRGALDDRRDQLLELLAGDLARIVFAAGEIHLYARSWIC